MGTYKFECKNCGAVHTKNENDPNIKCCTKPEIVLLAFELSEAELSEYKAQLGDSYKEIQDIIKQYVDLPEDYIKFLSTWVLGTYFHSCFSTYPYLFLWAMRGSGKTRTLKLISALSAGGDGSVQNNLTEAVLFRIPQGTTTCIDEMEQVGSKEKQTLREILNSAYKKGMKVKRMKKVKKASGEDYVVETY